MRNPARFINFSAFAVVQIKSNLSALLGACVYVREYLFISTLLCVIIMLMTLRLSLGC